MAIIHITRPHASQLGVRGERPGDRLRRYATAEAARGNVAVRAALFGTAFSAVSALVGVAIFGFDGAHQLFRDIGPVTALSVVGILAVGYLGLLIAAAEAPAGGIRRLTNFWALAGAGFLVLSLDAPLDLHGRLGGAIQSQTALAQDLGFHQTSDAVLAVYMLAGLAVAAVYWREVLRYPVVLAHLIAGVFLMGGTVAIDGFGAHSSLTWVLEETVELWAIAAFVGGFAVRLGIANERAGVALPLLVARRRAAA
ncbi:MAG: hypothetical protein IT303_04270 [Dehalococcoidia bacterium]|nr:hypothetical protein [Dehalococcoidia bacterium]